MKDATTLAVIRKAIETHGIDELARRLADDTGGDAVSWSDKYAYFRDLLTNADNSPPGGSP